MADVTWLACPLCFSNNGLRDTARRFAASSVGTCPTCERVGEWKLTKEQLNETIGEFFVLGSYIAETYAPVYQVNNLNSHPATFDATLATDAALASRLTGQVIFNYGPPLWRLGYTEHYYAFENEGPARTAAASEIVGVGKAITVASGTSLFRIRLNARADEYISTPQAFDPPPDSLGHAPGRWDESGHPVLYVADDIELCLHECRATISDEIIVATIRPNRDLQILDLSAPIEVDAGTPFEDPNIFIGIMCLSRGPWLDYCREIARAARLAGYDGVRYTSYYAQAKHAQPSLNLALFGRPLEEGFMSVQSLNRLRISDSAYQFRFGPVLYQDSATTAELADMKSAWAEIAADPEGALPG